MKKHIETTFDNILNPNPTQAPTQEQDTATEKIKGNYKTVCYSIPPDVADKMRQIAAWDRRKLNAVVTEAFEKFIAEWKPIIAEPPKF